MKHWIFLLPLLLATLACSFAVANDSTDATDLRPVVDEARPAVTILSPRADETYALGTTVLLLAEARDLTSGVTEIIFLDNFDGEIGRVTASNVAGDGILTGVVEWQPPTAQRHFIKAQAVRADGVRSDIREVSILVAAVEGFQPAAQSAPQTDADAPVSEITAPTQTTVSNEPQPTATDEPITQEPAPAEPESTGTLQGTTTVTINIRVAPNTAAAIAANPLQPNTTIDLIGRSEDNLWYAIPLSTGGTGWVFGSGVTVNGDPNQLPLVAAP